MYFLWRTLFPQSSSLRGVFKNPPEPKPRLQGVVPEFLAEFVDFGEFYGRDLFDVER